MDQIYSYILSAKDNTTSAFKSVEKNITKFEKKVQGASKKIDESFKKVENKFDNIAKKGKAWSASVTLPILAVGGAGIKVAADLETMEVAFTTMLGSAKKGKDMLQDLVKFTATTPFQLQGVGQAARQLLAFGVNAEHIQPVLKMVGDVAAGANVPLNDMALIFGKIIAKGTLTTEALDQLNERGVPVLETLTKKLNVSRAEIFRMAKDAEISSAVVAEAFMMMTGEGGKFQDMMAKQSQTINGLFSTMKDVVTLALGEIGQDIVDTFDVKAGMTNFINWAGRMTEAWKQLTPETKKVIITTAGLLAVLPPLIAMVGVLGKNVILGAGLIKNLGVKMLWVGTTAAKGLAKGLMFLISGPIGWMMAAVAALAAAYTTNFLGIQDVIDAFVGKAIKLPKVMWAVVKGIVKVFGGLLEDVGEIVFGVANLFGDMVKGIFGWFSAQSWGDLWSGFVSSTGSILSSVGSSIANWAKNAWASFQAWWSGEDIEPPKVDISSAVDQANAAAKAVEAVEYKPKEKSIFNFDKTKTAAQTTGLEIQSILNSPDWDMSQAIGRKADQAKDVLENKFGGMMNVVGDFKKMFSGELTEGVEGADVLGAANLKKQQEDFIKSLEAMNGGGGAGGGKGGGGAKKGLGGVDKDVEESIKSVGKNELAYDSLGKTAKEVASSMAEDSESTTDKVLYDNARQIESNEKLKDSLEALRSARKKSSEQYQLESKDKFAMEKRKKLDLGGKTIAQVTGAAGAPSRAPSGGGRPIPWAGARGQRISIGDLLNLIGQKQFTAQSVKNRMEQSQKDMQVAMVDSMISQAFGSGKAFSQGKAEQIAQSRGFGSYSEFQTARSAYYDRVNRGEAPGRATLLKSGASLGQQQETLAGVQSDLKFLIELSRTMQRGRQEFGYIPPARRAYGGTMVPGQDYIVGERGRERIRVGQMSRIDPITETAPAMPPINITITGNNINDREQVRYLCEMVEEKMKRTLQLYNKNIR